MNNIILYVDKKSERLLYIASFLFHKILGIEIEITNDVNAIKEHSGFKINYTSHESVAADIQIIPHELLNQLNIESQNIEMKTWNQLPCFFTTSKLEIPFDIFSASFYLLTRYEEYFSFEPDLYQRFPVENSLAFQQKFLSIPLIDLWMMEIKKIIHAKKPHFEFSEKEMTFLPTYDIDIAYSYKGKSAMKTIGGLIRDLLNGDFDLIHERIKVLQGNQKDPYDSYDLLNEIHQKYHLKPIYFFLMSDGGKFDKNISPKHQLMNRLITETKSKYDVGIHPSFKSNDYINILQKEINRIDTLKSRQHYIRFSLPTTFRNLIHCGIKEDYSMGYGSMNGFRASTSFPHQWFDLEKNEVSDLKLYPFCYMECNSFYEQHETPQQALLELKHYLKIIQQVNGNMITIWHNFSLGSDKVWKSWKEVYLEFLIEASIPKQNI